MDKQRIVITGLGVVAPNGLGKEEFWNNCAAGVSGIKSITLFDTSTYRCHHAGEISDFHPEQYLGAKGLRNLDRTTLLALVAAKLAIEDAKLEITDENRNDIGVVLGSTMGSVHSISEFDKVGLREGPRYVNPALFPNAVINSPASQVAIRFGLRGLNSTISTGFSASLDAIGYAMDMLRLGRAKTLLVGGVEELCIQTFLGFYKLRLLATSPNGALPLFEPFSERSCGTLLGEGAAFFVLEPREQALERNGAIYGDLLGYDSQFHPASMHRYDPEAAGPIVVMRGALNMAQVDFEDVDHISACANSIKAGDTMEQTAIRAVFGSRAHDVTISSVKSMIGESFSAGGALQLAATLGVFARQQISAATSSHDPRAPRTWSDRPVAATTVASVRHALVDAFSPTGVSAALVIGACDGH